MRWTVTLVAEIEPGQRIEHEIVAVDRDDRITPASLGLSIAEGKAVLAAILDAVVVDQVERHGRSPACGERRQRHGPHPQQVDGGAPIHLAWQHLQAIDVPRRPGRCAMVG